MGGRFRVREAQLTRRVMRPTLGGKEIGREDAIVEDQPGEELGFSLSKSPPNLGGLELWEGAFELSSVGRGGGVTPIRRPAPSDGVSLIRHKVGFLNNGGYVQELGKLSEVG